MSAVIPSIGFGARASTPSNAKKVQVADLAKLKKELTKLAAAPAATATPLLLELTGDKYDFTNESTRAFIIRAKGLTIAGADGKSIVLRKLRLRIDLDVSDNIVIRNLTFRSDGADDDARDAIAFEPLSPPARPPASTPAGAVNARITECSFDGYYDIAVDSDVDPRHPRLLLNVDHCLFFDTRPGAPITTKKNGKQILEFANRGAINIASADTVGNASATVADNVFIQVWRRTPRVARGNQAHIFNNLVYQWGAGYPADGTAVGGDEWVAMVADNGGEAAIQGNRFIPYPGKLTANKTINVDQTSKIFLGTEARVTGMSGTGTPSFSDPDAANTNEFDGINGRGPAPAGLPPTSGRIMNIDLVGWYDSVGLDAPQFRTTGSVDWTALVNAAGPPTFNKANVTRDLLALL